MKKLLIFDFDGVLEDTFDWNFEVAKKRYKNLKKEDYRNWFDGNIYEHPVVKDAGPLNVIEYFEEYKKGFIRKKLDKRFKEMLLKLKINYHLVIISSIDDNIINPYLKRSGVSYIFEEVWGIRRKTSKEEKFKDFLKLYNIEKKNCLFITDTLGDIKEANKVGLRSIGVTWGYQNEEKLKVGNPVFIAHNIKELEDYLLRK